MVCCMCAKGHYRSLTKLREGNVFSHVFLSVCLSTEGSNVTITHDELDLTAQVPFLYKDLAPLSFVQGPRPNPSLSPASDIWWLVGASKQYASYWNAFLFRFISGCDACQSLVDQYTDSSIMFSVEYSGVWLCQFVNMGNNFMIPFLECTYGIYMYLFKL